MTFSVEVVPRGRTHAVTESVSVDGPEPAAWTEAHVAEILRAILRAIDRVVHPDRDARPVFLRGFSWIVEPFGTGVVIALEIGDGAAVAGPFAIDQGRLDALVVRAIAAERAAGAGGRSVH